VPAVSFIIEKAVQVPSHCPRYTNYRREVQRAKLRHRVATGTGTRFVRIAAAAVRIGAPLWNVSGPGQGLSCCHQWQLSQWYPSSAASVLLVLGLKVQEISAPENSGQGGNIGPSFTRASRASVARAKLAPLCHSSRCSWSALLPPPLLPLQPFQPPLSLLPKASPGSLRPASLSSPPLK